MACSARTAHSMGYPATVLLVLRVTNSAPDILKFVPRNMFLTNVFRGFWLKGNIKKWIQIWPLETDTCGHITLHKVFDLSMPRFTYLENRIIIIILIIYLSIYLIKVVVGLMNQGRQSG